MEATSTQSRGHSRELYSVVIPDVADPDYSVSNRSAEAIAHVNDYVHALTLLGVPFEAGSSKGFDNSLIVEAVGGHGS